MMRVKDRDGNVLTEIDESRFPLSVSMDTCTASVKEYVIRFVYVVDPTTKRKDRTKVRGVVMFGA